MPTTRDPDARRRAERRTSLLLAAFALTGLLATTLALAASAPSPFDARTISMDLRRPSR